MKKDFGTTSKGEKTTLYIMKNGNGMEVHVTDYGATLTSILVPDKNGKPVNVTLGYDDAAGYEAGTCFFGASVGRIANRIGGAKFTLNGKTYELAKNDNDNNLHSGLDFWTKRMWQVKEADDAHVIFVLNSPDMDQGYPGALTVEITYTLTEDNELKIHYYGVPEEDTIINMTNHSYFNLNGHDSGDMFAQEVWVDADAITEADAQSIPTGRFLDVTGTPMDFRVKKPVGRDAGADYEQLKFGSGYDHNWVLNGSGYRKVAEMSANESGITMEVYTDLPGMQIYASNFVDNEKGRDGAVYNQHHGICFETQFFPDAVNKEMFEGPVVKAGEEYNTTTTYKFC